jgi:hypothetical protein
MHTRLNVTKNFNPLLDRNVTVYEFLCALYLPDYNVLHHTGRGRSV